MKLIEIRKTPQPSGKYKIVLTFALEEEPLDLHSLHADPDSLNQKKPQSELLQTADEFAREFGCRATSVLETDIYTGFPRIEFTGPYDKLYKISVELIGETNINEPYSREDFARVVQKA